MQSLIGHIEPKAINALRPNADARNRIRFGRNVFTQSKQPKASTDSPTITMQKDMIPVTHLLAGASLPMGDDIKEEVYDYANPVNFDFLDSIEAICSFFEYALEHELVSAQEIKDVISIEPIARFSQESACTALIGKALAKLIDTNRNTALLTPLLDHLDTNEESTFLVSNDWELDFELATPITVDSTFEDFPIDGLHLISKSFGLVNLEANIITLDVCEKVRMHMMQLIYFCSRLSGHVTTLDLFTDEYIQFLVTGLDCDENVSELSEEEKEYYDLDYINEFLSVKKDCKKWVKKLETTPLTKNIKALRARMQADAKLVPSWLIVVTDILIESIIENNDIYDSAVMGCGSFPFEYSRPISFGLKSECEILSNIHESIANSDELNLFLKLKPNTPSLLTTIDLVEKLLMFISDKLYSMQIKEKNHG